MSKTPEPPKEPVARMPASLEFFSEPVDPLDEIVIIETADSVEYARAVKFTLDDNTKKEINNHYILKSRVEAAIPKKRKLPGINEEWQEPWMHRVGGEVDYNAAIDEFKKNLGLE